ncbi:putative peroxidase 61 [Hibiscus syriacus]|uniref:peroxidase n=1 Tax=Hibiscus syriacus TaxID=106335 RepID=A0A6A2ZUE8_HIBSY|nr:putative peroxidase 61 [Hibiscus syriacus]
MTTERFGFVFPVWLALAVLSLWCTSEVVEVASSLQKPMKLVWHYYKVHNSCDDAEPYIRHQGCDASILLDGPDSEKIAPQNRGLGGFVLIDKIKTVLEVRCLGAVSCAEPQEILFIWYQSITTINFLRAGAPSYPEFTGRRDGLTSTKASVDLPSPSISWEASLAYFKSKGLDVLDMATLLGAHSMGRTHCGFIVDRLYNFNNTGKPDPMLTHEAVLEVDQQLLYGDDTKQITEEFAAGLEDFRRSFALSMSRMGNIEVLTGKQGEIRKNCRRTNKY